MVRLIPFTALLLLVMLPPAGWTAELRNLRAGQEGKRAYLQYDLAGKPGEKEADVTVSIEIGGERYSSGKLALAGDLGKSVPVGIGKRIWWDLLKDMPAGYEGEIGWTLDVTPATGQTASIKAQKDLEEQRRTERLQQSSEQQAALPKPGPQQTRPAFPAAMPGLPDNGVFKVLRDAVIDKRNRLMWAKLGNDTSEKFSYEKARGYIARMNREKFGGFNDWRLPGDSEVAKLFAATAVITTRTGKPAFKVLLHYFPNLENWRYWQDFPTSRGYGKGQNYRRSFDIEDGAATGDLMNDELCILPVRDATNAPPQRGQEQDS